MELLEGSPRGVILFVDSKNKPQLAEAAEMLYDMLNNENILEQRTPILIACNKQDLQFAKRATQIQTDMEKELEELRKVRRATQDD